MADAPRPIILRFYMGRGLQPARRESADTSRAVVEQVALNYAENTFEEYRAVLGERIKKDAEAEMTHMAKLFRQFIIGSSGYSSTPKGTLTALSKDPSTPGPRRSLSSMIPAWVPRSEQYLRDKKAGGGGVKWFDNTGWRDGGYLRGAFQPEGGAYTGMFTDGGGIFAEMFGGVSVEIRRNIKGSGTLSGSITGRGIRGTQYNTQLATIRVRAFGDISRAMLNANSTGNPALMNLVGRYDEELMVRFRNRTGRYRPAFEPFLKFYLQEALPHAVQARVRKGDSGGTLFRT